MGLIFRKSVSLGRGLRLNLSRTGLSASVRLGPVTVNSRGRTSVRLGRGVSYRTTTHRR